MFRYLVLLSTIMMAMLFPASANSIAENRKVFSNVTQTIAYFEHNYGPARRPF